jgi:pimeloyl-ACP methyl ester carboxylesterase
MLDGSAQPFDESAIRYMSGADFDRTPNLQTTFNHATLRSADRWVGLLDDLEAPALIIHGTEDRALPYAHALALNQLRFY